MVPSLVSSCSSLHPRTIGTLPANEPMFRQRWRARKRTSPVSHGDDVKRKVPDTTRGATKVPRTETVHVLPNDRPVRRNANEPDPLIGARTSATYSGRKQRLVVPENVSTWRRSFATKSATLGSFCMYIPATGRAAAAVATTERPARAGSMMRRPRSMASMLALGENGRYRPDRLGT